MEQATAGSVHIPWSSASAMTPTCRCFSMLAANNGYVEWCALTEPIDFKLSAFLDKVGAEPVQNLSLAVTPAGM